MIEELFPAAISMMIQVNVDKGVTFGLDRFLDKFHSCLLGISPALFNITFDACTDNIFPAVLAANAPWNNVIE